jgi:nicotinate-nucleotide adenylyltransferase
MSRIGILGGTFDPVHIAHLMLADFACKELSLDKTLLMPTGESPHKEEERLTPLKDRLAMLELAAEENPHLELSLFEVEAKEKSYTYRTAERLHEHFPEEDFYFIMGGDSLGYFDHWVHPEIIAKYLHLAVTIRGEMDEKAARKQAELLREKFDADISFFSLPSMELSSTMIRERIKQEKSIHYLVPERVLEYIENKGLYRA